MTVSVDARTQGEEGVVVSAPGTLEDAFIAQCEADCTLAEITAIVHVAPGKSSPPTHVLAVVELLHKHLEPNPLIGLPPESDGYPRRGGAWRTVAGNYRTLLSSATNRIYVAAVLLEGGASFGEIESAIDLAPHRLLDTIAELRNDFSVHDLCAFVSGAAKRHEREQSEKAPAP